MFVVYALVATDNFLYIGNPCLLQITPLKYDCLNLLDPVAPIMRICKVRVLVYFQQLCNREISYKLFMQMESNFAKLPHKKKKFRLRTEPHFFYTKAKEEKKRNFSCVKEIKCHSLLLLTFILFMFNFLPFGGLCYAVFSFIVIFCEILFCHGLLNL